VHASFDDELLPRYQRIAFRAGRRLRPGVIWADVGAAMTAIAEGVAMRHLDDPSSRHRTLQWAVGFHGILWEGLTEPIDGTQLDDQGVDRAGPPCGTPERR